MTEWRWTLPELLNEHLHDRQQISDHFGLLLDKFTPYAEYKYPVRRQNTEETERGYRLGKENLKRNWLNSVLDLTNQQAISPVTQDYRLRWEAVVQAAGGNHYRMVTTGPLIVGLGAGHILETSITLDRNTGLPLIPGSALKGLTRMAGLIEVAQAILDNPSSQILQNLDEEITTVTDETDIDSHITQLRKGISAQELEVLEIFIQIFGTQNRAGNVVYMDGIYAGDIFPKYRLDIMNPHFPDYYRSKDKHPPSDDQNPNPVPYLTIDVEQPFLFAVLPRTKDSTFLLPTAERWLIEGLTNFGIGAKTSQGYGLFIKAK